MTGHQINSLVGDLVAMAQAMERLPQVEAELVDARNVLTEMDKAQDSLKADLEQSRTYAATLEAKVHAAEASRDDAELRFLEADDRLAKAMSFLVGVREEAHAVMDVIDPPKPSPQSWNYGPNDIGAEPIISEVKPIAADPIQPNSSPMVSGENGMASDGGTAQGQSEADPIQPLPATTPTAEQSLASVNETVTSEANATGSWASPTPPKPQPYAGHNYFDWPDYVSYDKWIEGGGTHDDYYERRHQGF